MAGEIVYGFLDPSSGEILYVGSTKNLKVRISAHRSTKPFLKDCYVVVFRINPQAPLLKVEAQIIESYKKRGQCRLNDERYHHAQLKPRALDEWRLYEVHAKSQMATVRLIETALKGLLEREERWGWTHIACHGGKSLKAVQKISSKYTSLR